MIHQVTSNGEQLTDSHINAQNQLLKSQFPDFQGLSSPVLGQICFRKFEWAGKYAGQIYIQMLHTTAVTIEINSVEGVHIYDSLFIKPNYCIIKQITSALLSRNHQFHIHLEKYNFNKTPLIVGYEYAMAFITELCHKIDPFVFHHV